MFYIVLQATLTENKQLSLDEKRKILSSLTASQKLQGTNHSMRWDVFYSWAEAILNALWTLRMKSPLPHISLFKVSGALHDT